MKPDRRRRRSPAKRTKTDDLDQVVRRPVDRPDRGGRPDVDEPLPHLIAVHRFLSRYDNTVSQILRGGFCGPDGLLQGVNDLLGAYSI